MDSSSFASLAYYCRGAAQPAVFGVKHVKDFFDSGNYTNAKYPDIATAMSRSGNLDEYVPSSKDMCKCLLVQENAWANPMYMSFDNFPEAFLLLLEIYSTEGWLDYMYYNVDAKGIEMQPFHFGASDAGGRGSRRSSSSGSAPQRGSGAQARQCARTGADSPKHRAKFSRACSSSVSLRARSVSDPNAR